MAKITPIEEHRPNPITLTDNESGRVYILEFNRDSVRWAERQGFDITELTKFPMTNIPRLFFFAFRMHHKGITQDQTDAMLDELGATRKLLERLVQLYSAPMDSLVDEDTAKNGRYSV